MTKGIFVPDELRFAITRKCDGNCRHCYNQSGKNTDRLSAEDFIRLIHEVRMQNPALDRITLTGGEPLSEVEKVCSISKYARLSGIRVRLVTRGWELDKALCKRLKNSGVTRLQIGLDSSGLKIFTDDHGNTWDTIHSWLRVDTEGFRKSTRAIKLASEAGLDVSVRYSLCHSNIQDVVNTYNFVSGLGVSKFKFRVLFPDGRAKNRLVREIITGKEMAYAQFELISASAGNPTIIEITQPCFYPLPGREALQTGNFPHNSFKEICPCGTKAAYIDSNGDVKYCLFDEEILGNIFESPFLTIWNSASVGKVRKFRCPFDLTGHDCSSFRLLYNQFGDYEEFIREYSKSLIEIPYKL